MRMSDQEAFSLYNPLLHSQLSSKEALNTMMQAWIWFGFMAYQSL